MADKLVTIARFSDSTQAYLTKQLLADFGIESFIAGENFSNLWPMFKWASVRLQVLKGEAEKALEIIESNRKGSEGI